MTQYELAFYDEVLKAHVMTSNELDEIRNPWADEIEKEDAELERRKAMNQVIVCACFNTLFELSTEKALSFSILYYKFV